MDSKPTEACIDPPGRSVGRARWRGNGRVTFGDRRWSRPDGRRPPSASPRSGGSSGCLRHVLSAVVGPSQRAMPRASPAAEAGDEISPRARRNCSARTGRGRRSTLLNAVPVARDLDRSTYGTHSRDLERDGRRWRINQVRGVIAVPDRRASPDGPLGGDAVACRGHRVAVGRGVRQLPHPDRVEDDDADAGHRQVDATIVMPPRGFWRSVTSRRRPAARAPRRRRRGSAPRAPRRTRPRCGTA